jgi:hypothetical protein
MSERIPGRLAPEEEVLYVYRKLIYVLYLEIGALQPRIHAEVAARADMRSAFFERNKERHAAALYHQSESERDPAKIEAPYQQRTGLTLEDIHQAFAEGEWKNKFGQYNFGGPKWEHIAKLTLELRGLIQKGEWGDAAALVYDIKKLKTNQGHLVNQFERSERRRPEGERKTDAGSERGAERKKGGGRPQQGGPRR